MNLNININKITNILKLKFLIYKNAYNSLSFPTFIIILTILIIILNSIYFGTYFVLLKINTLPLLAIPLKDYIFNLACFSFFAMLILSSMLSAFSILFNPIEISMLLSKPLNYFEIFIAKFFELSFFSVFNSFLVFIIFTLAYFNSYQNNILVFF